MVDSSTFWAGIVGFGLHIGAAAMGHPIPWEVLAAWMGAFGLKEAARRRTGD